MQIDYLNRLPLEKRQQSMDTILADVASDAYESEDGDTDLAQIESDIVEAAGLGRGHPLEQVFRAHVREALVDPDFETYFDAVKAINYSIGWMVHLEQFKNYPMKYGQYEVPD